MRVFWRTPHRPSPSPTSPLLPPIPQSPDGTHFSLQTSSCTSLQPWGEMNYSTKRKQKKTSTNQHLVNNYLMTEGGTISDRGKGGDVSTITSTKSSSLVSRLSKSRIEWMERSNTKKK